MGEKRQVDPVARRTGRAIMFLILLIDCVLLVTNWDRFTTPIPKDRFGVIGQLLGGSAAFALIARLAAVTLIMAIIGSILGLMFRGQLLSRFGQTEAEPIPSAEPLETMDATDAELHARVEGLENAVSDLITYEREQQNPEDNS